MGFFVAMEHILYRIVCDRLYYKVKGYKLIIKYPNIKVRYHAACLYEKIYHKSIKRGLLKTEDIKQFLYPNGLLTQDDDEILKVAPKHIDYFKKELYYNNGNATKVEQLKKYLNTARESLAKSQGKLHRFDYITAEGVANFAKWQFIIEHSVFYKNKRWKWKDGTVNDALNYYYDNIIDDNIIRLLSHTPPFDGIWSTGRVFDQLGFNLTLDQQKLIGWAKLYDNINESLERPPQRVIDDDDILDGWLLVQREKREQDDNKRRADELIKNPKIANADEIFIMPTLLSPKEVQDLNNPMSKMIIKQRLDQIKRAGGELREQDLEDVQRKLMMQQTHALRGKYA